MQSSYITSAAQAEQLPDLGTPEVAFIGRSNCGKSSLLNALLARKGLARQSNTPGRTQMANFFGLEKGEERLVLVDLPGYGYSAIGKEARASWQTLVTAYLRRPYIRDLLFLLDIRRVDPLNDEDMALLQQLADRPHPATITIVLTKADKVTRSVMTTTVAKLTQGLKAQQLGKVKIVVVSSTKKTGIEALKQTLFADFL